MTADGQEDQAQDLEAPVPGVLVVTGGASGIGLATARHCGRAGWRVVLLDLAEPLRQAAGKLSGELWHSSSVTADIRDFDAVEGAFEQVVRQVGEPSAVVASAGIADQSNLVTGDPTRWRSVIETNLLGTANTLRAAAPLLAERGGGDLVVIASLSGRETYVGEPAYIASKWGTVGLGHAARRELAARGIRVTLIEPGLVDTPLTRSSPVVKQLLDRAPSLLPEDVAEAVLWVLSRPRRVAIDEIALRAHGYGDVSLEA
ncbi:MAG TPA: SDR family oxidoreductase [Acidimicrobiales bacterium]|nr:SDR family oxidoreductase [Acidimicrobiales bacterium]